MLYGGIEAGGTKFICAVADDPPRIHKTISFATTLPDETLAQVFEFFAPFASRGQLAGIGVASFGPLDVDRRSPSYGSILETPKPGWRNFNLLARMQHELPVPLHFEMDVCGAALGEHAWGASRGLDPSLYITIGTGIGGGYLVNGKPHTGLTALEMGHIRVPHDRSSDPFPGNCPYHGDCLEGLAAGPAILARVERPGEQIPEGDPFWKLEVEYIANALTNFILTLSPRVIILGGGVMQKTFLYPMLRARVQALLNGYLGAYEINKDMERYILPPALGGFSGVLGAIAMAMPGKE